MDYPAPPLEITEMEELRAWCQGFYEYLASKPFFPGGLCIGDSTNYTEIKNDGEINLHGTARTKCIVRFTDELEHGATPPDYTELGDYPTWSYDVDDDSKIATVIPRWADSSATAQIHIIWCINEAYATNSGEIQWQADWSACPYDSTEALDSPTHNGQIKSGDVNIPATAKFLTVTSLTAIAAASIADDDIMGAKISRIAKDDGADPTADPCIVAVLIEFTKDKLGEAT